MDLTDAPLFTDVSPGPEDGVARWVSTSDGARIRVAAWGRDAEEGTVLLFPGRTEYVEKYGLAAFEFQERGFATLAVDWRGQGLADRMIKDPLIGYVDDFRDYQKDVSAALRVAHALDLPKPWFLLGHSMGGCIGLRALMEGIDVKAAAFTGPMWGIGMSDALRPFAWTLSTVLPFIGAGLTLPPGTRHEPYVLTDPYADNTLTRDLPMYKMMRDQLEAHRDLSLGAPCFIWLREALRDCARLAAMPSPGVSCLTYLGTNERIVHTDSIRDRMARWPGGTLEIVEDGEHEVLMEVPETRKAVFDGLAAHFCAAC